MATRIGCDNLVFAQVTTEGDRATLPVWDTPVAAPGVMSIGINPNSSISTLFFDDGPGEVAATLGEIEISIMKNELTAALMKYILGNVTDASGGVVKGGNDVSPWVAVGFRTLKSNGTYKYVWLYQMKFQEPETNQETRKDTVEFQAEELVGKAVKIPTQIKVKETDVDVTGIEKQPWQYNIDEETPDVTQATIDGWFTNVTLPQQVA